MDFPSILAAEFGRRRARSPRYSLRAFARDLGLDHATLSQLLRRRRRLSPRLIHQLGPRLGLDAPALAEACAQLHADIVLRFTRSRTFRPNSRWIATRTGLPLDTVNTALHRLLFQRRLAMDSVDRWTVSSASHA